MFLEKIFSEVKDEKKSSVKINLRFISSLKVKIDMMKKMLKADIDGFEEDETFDL